MIKQEKFDGVLEEANSSGFNYERSISEDLLDKDNEHLGYLGFVRIFEEAQKSLQAVGGVDYDNLFEKFGIRLFVKKMNVEYKKEVRLGENIKVFTPTPRIGETSVTYNQEMQNDKNEVVAISEFVLVGVDESGKPAAIPKEAAQRFTISEEN